MPETSSREANLIAFVGKEPVQVRIDRLGRKKGSTIGAGSKTGQFREGASNAGAACDVGLCVSGGWKGLP